MVDRLQSNWKTSVFLISGKCSKSVAHIGVVLRLESFFAKVFLLMFLQSVTRALFDNLLVEIGRGQTAGSIKQRSGPDSPDIGYLSRQPRYWILDICPENQDIGYWIFATIAQILDNM